MLSGTLRQIVLISDGRSNRGYSPVNAALNACCNGIRVNAIGILDTGHLGLAGRGEMSRIAAAGGGMCRFISMDNLAYTISSITQQAVRCAVERELNRRLTAQVGTGLAGISPAGREALIPVLTKMEEEAKLDLALVIDTSGSMEKKRRLLEKGLLDLILSLSSRKGTVNLAIIRYPGKVGYADLIKPLNGNNSLTAGVLRRISFGGLTPTGPAIAAAAAILTCSHINEGETGVVVTT